jgi:hypothetical protein
MKELGGESRSVLMAGQNLLAENPATSFPGPRMTRGPVSTPKKKALKMTNADMHSGAHGRNTQVEVASLVFHGDRLATFLVAEEPHVAMRPIVEALGLSWGTQVNKINGQMKKFSCVHMNTTGGDGKTYRMLAMPVKKLNLWLATINPNKIKDATRRAKVELYQEESAKALFDYWSTGVAVRDDFDGVITDIDPKVMNAIGGMVKGIVNKALTELVPALVLQHFAESDIGIVHGVTSFDVTQMAGITDRRRLRGLGQFISNRLRMYHAQEGVAVKLRDQGSMGPVLVYDKALSKQWLASGGKSMVEQYVKKRLGQGNLHLVGKAPCN